MSIDAASRLTYQHQLSVARNAIRLALADSRSPVVSTKFSESSAVFLHLVSQVQPGIPVIWVNTGYNSRNTLAFSNEVSAQLDITLHIFRPDAHEIRMPPSLDDPDHAAFTREVKIEPFQRALRSLEADTWLSSIRGYQSEHRSRQPIFQQLPDGMLKVSPLQGWSADTVERYRIENDLPLGPSCFDPTKGEPFRECGLHLDLAG